MKVLLDTHAFLWFVLDSGQLRASAKAWIENPANEVFVSPASFWELAIKVSLGKIALKTSYDQLMHQGIVGNDFQVLPIEPRHTSRLTTMPFHHRDPFDRLLVAQALVENLPIVSADTALDAYGVMRHW